MSAITVERNSLGYYLIKYKRKSKIYTREGRKEAIAQFRKDFGLSYMKLEIINLK
jgi:hypothetical protein